MIKRKQRKMNQSSLEKLFRQHHARLLAEARSMLYDDAEAQKIAAVFLGIVFLCGLVFAAIRLVATDPALEVATTDTAIETIDSPSEDVMGTVRFDNVRLDSILSTVAAHYGKNVRFFNDEAKAMKFIMTWKPDAPLTDFIDRLNMFDGIRLSIQRDTIFVEITEGKEDKE